MRIKLTKEEKQATKDVIKRFKKNGCDLSKDYDIEFILTNGEDSHIGLLEEFMNKINISYKSIELNGDELILTITMKLNYGNIIKIEEYLTYFASENNLKYEGWGAFE